jgi:LytR cell envelope-related transcriptional attenuator
VDLIKEIGAYAGLGAFLGLAVLSLLYFSQARDVRRLREWAGRAPERDAEEVEATSGLASERAEEVRKIEDERRRREEAVRGERDAAAQRQERRRRREAGLPEQTPRERIRERFGAAFRGHSRLEPRYVAVVIGAVIVIGAAAAALAINAGGGGNGDGSKQTALKPSQFEVAVLNGTNPPVNGLAGTVSDKLESEGFHTGRVTNSRNSFTQSVVMFSRGHKPEAAKVARNLGIHKLRLMTPDIRSDSAGSTVSVVVGQDKANFTGAS